MTDRRGPTCERIWFCYLACVAAVAVFTPGGGTPGHDRATFLWVHGIVFVAALGCRWLAVHRSPDAARIPRVAMGLIGLPVVFSSLCWLLPAVHPEPYEFAFQDLDRALFGRDLGHFVDAWPGWLVELFQLCYASFYFLCMVAALGAGIGSGKAAFDRAVLWLVGGFLFSYLGYLLVPTLGPNVVAAFAHEVRGVWLTTAVREAIDAGEANPWDCFPSGHTMMTIISLLILWRWNRRWFPFVLVPGLIVIASTVLLRYHWSADVVVGALLAWPLARACERLADRDGWPRAEAPLSPAGS